MEGGGGTYGDADPRHELFTTLETAMSWLQGALSTWAGLSEPRKLEMVAAALTSLNGLQAQLRDVQIAPHPGAPEDGHRLEVRVTPERPSLVDLAVDDSETEETVRVKLVFHDRTLVGESPARSDLGRDRNGAARATLNAVQLLVDEPLRLVESQVLQIGSGVFAVVCVQSSTRLLLGSALVEDGLRTAMARATLDASNRLIDRTSRKDDRTIQLH